VSATTISVVICAYTEERWDDLLAAIASVRQQRIPAHQVIVVIDQNACLLERARAWAADSDVIIVENTHAPGLSGARNSGVAVASGDIVAFLDDDAEADLDWLAHLLSCYDDVRVLGAGGAIIPRWVQGRPAWFPAEFDWVIGCTYRGMPTTTAPVRNLIGANMSFRREVFAEVGTFRTGFGQVAGSMLRCDDTEFCLKVHHHLPQAILLYEPRALVHHHVPLGRARWSYFRLRCFTEGQAKALLTRLFGPSEGLSTERTYTIKTLPEGVRRGLTDTFVRRDRTGIVRAATIVAGLAFTGAGYIRGDGVRRRQLRPPRPFRPKDRPLPGSAHRFRH
jgi:glycosyltransferase involved in cell wall biosynthesis